MSKRHDPTYGTRRRPDLVPPPVRIFTDGGLLSPNPSNRGGSWAWCRVERDAIVSEASGVIWADDMPDGTVSSNQAEFYAVLQAFRSLADQEIVDVYLDSDVTFSRWYGDGRFGNRGVPPAWWEAMNGELRRHGGSNWHRIAGHPSSRPNGPDGKSDLERGYKLRRDGSPGDSVNKWNVHVDAMCTLQAALGNLILECRSVADAEAWRIILDHSAQITEEVAHG